MTRSRSTLPPTGPVPELAPPWFAELLEPEFWPDESTEVELVETHISWVFLTRRFAYKLKKPVSLDFLDFQSLSSRRQASEDEVRLNRRLAADVYLGVVAITELPCGSVELNGTGAVVDYLVKMVRLNSAERLDVRFEQGSLKMGDVSPLIRTLTSFYQHAPPLKLCPESYLENYEQHIRANHQSLIELQLEGSNAKVEQATTAQLTVLKLYSDLLSNRVRDGRVIEGHGDLRPEHVYLTSPPVIVDCIEFNADFRQLDVADELCFLAMECDALNQPALGEQLLARCLAELDDHPSELLLAFYKSYRATVRAKVAAIRAQQQPAGQRSHAIEKGQGDLQRAIGYLAPYLPPMLIVVGGLMGSGKSTIAAALAKAINLDHLQTDTLRQQLQGSADHAEKFAAGKYSDEQRMQVYVEMFRAAEAKLSQGISVVLDGTFIQRDLRQAAAELAQRVGAHHELVWCRCPPELAKQRIAARREQGKDASQARPELLDEQRISAEFPSTSEAVFEIDASQPCPNELAQLFNHMAAKLSGKTYSCELPNDSAYP